MSFSRYEDDQCDVPIDCPQEILDLLANGEMKSLRLRGKHGSVKSDAVLMMELHDGRKIESTIQSSARFLSIIVKDKMYFRKKSMRTPAFFYQDHGADVHECYHKFSLNEEGLPKFPAENISAVQFAEIYSALPEAVCALLMRRNRQIAQDQLAENSCGRCNIV